MKNLIKSKDIRLARARILYLYFQFNKTAKCRTWDILTYHDYFVLQGEMLRNAYQFSRKLVTEGNGDSNLVLHWKSTFAHIFLRTFYMYITAYVYISIHLCSQNNATGLIKNFEIIISTAVNKSFVKNNSTRVPLCKIVRKFNPLVCTLGFQFVLVSAEWFIAPRLTDFTNRAGWKVLMKFVQDI